ncbi:MAG: 1-acyl-sn-glycerol-3-phosphate acyltransferase [Bacteroidales bacterium]|nr:1-acyl-sn-glycerol-3-phosphate acyltransferase [Bacteroidales bacterium]
MRGFIRLYRYFRTHRTMLYTLLGVSVLSMALCCLRLDFEENITSFFPDNEDSRNMLKVFDNLKVSDKFIVMFSSEEDGVEPDYDLIIEAADEFCSRISGKEDSDRLISDIVCGIDSGEMAEATAFVYDMLPVLLTEKDYAAIDSLLQPSSLRARMEENRRDLISPAGIFLKDYIMRDPLGIATGSLKELQNLNPMSEYQMVDGHVFSPDGSTLLCFITPGAGMGETGVNDRLVTMVEDELEQIEADFPGVSAMYFAGPAVGVYNARQIKKDTFLTSGFALVMIILFIFLAFRRRGSIPLIILPVLYGMLFALSLVSIFKGGISAIAVGTGAVVLGIALSYSIHMIAHQMHVRSVEQLVRELVFPLTVGSITTIGAFVGLMFTSSSLLRDFGLFASLTLVGTTLFSLVFLPHFLAPLADMGETPLMRRIERINGYSYEKNRWIVLAIAAMAVLCCFTSGRVGFNADMMSINYMPSHLAMAQERLESMSDTNVENVMLVSAGESMEEACNEYSAAGRILDSLLSCGRIAGYSTAGHFIVPEQEQQRRIAMWDSFWSGGRREAAIAAVEDAAVAAGFRKEAFNGFGDMLYREYKVTGYDDVMLLENWLDRSGSFTMLITSVAMDPSDKAEVYACFDPAGTVVFDRSFFAGMTVSSISDDFDMILYISSFLVFFVLWLSYGRLEVAVLCFLPMLLSWIVIIGMMGMLGVQFNIVNIIISTFIFGIGDDFSIFIMDGLIGKYALRKEILSSHKTAIFFSTFTIVAGMGAMILAGHPALHSIGVISILGMVAVVFIAFTLQPLLFGMFITGPASKGWHPYTIFGIIRSMMLWTVFIIACLLTIATVVLMLPLPLPMLWKQRTVRYMAYLGCRFVIWANSLAKVYFSNASGEDFSVPSVVVSNHTSFLDIVWVMALSPKLLIVAKGWVRKVPVFWPVAKFLGFYYSDDGYESITETFAERVKEGWSVAVFPEGTRETDGRVHRFHKGAFYMATTLGLDIVPVVMYGNDVILPKHRPLNMGPGVSAVKILPRVPSSGADYRTMSKQVRMMVAAEYGRMCAEYSTVDNLHFRWAVLRSMLYKGAKVEWETRMEMRKMDSYRDFDKALPRSGRILHLGCGLGQIDLMLKLLAPGREIVAVDADIENVVIAQNNYMRPEGLEYVCADPGTFDSSGYDAVFTGRSADSIRLCGNAGRSDGQNKL